MRQEDPRIDRDVLAETIRRGYGIEVTGLEFLPVGECSYDFAVRSRHGSYFAKIHTNAPSSRQSWDRALLEERLAATASLRERCDVEGVVAPLPSQHGVFALDFPAGPLALFPLIEGEWLRQNPRSAADIRLAGKLLGAIHACPPSVIRIEHLPEQYEIRYAETLRDLLLRDRLSGPELDPEYPAKSLLAAHRKPILDALNHLEALARGARAAGYAGVVTHGDPTQGNLLKTGDGSLNIVDWDDIALAPPERDLIYFGGLGFEDFVEAYASVTKPLPLHADVLAFYLYHWDLQEIADWGRRLVHGLADRTEIARDWDELGQYIPIRHEWIAASVAEMMHVLG